MHFYGLLAPHLLHECRDNLAYKDAAVSDSPPPALRFRPVQQCNILQRSPLIFMFVSTAMSGYWLLGDAMNCGGRHVKRNNTVCFPLDSLSGRSSFASICLPRRRLICFIYNRLYQSKFSPTSVAAALGRLHKQTGAKSTGSIEFYHCHCSVIND